MTELKTVALSDKKAFLGLRITDKEKELIKKYAKENNVTLTTFVRGIILDYIISEENKSK